MWRRPLVTRRCRRNTGDAFVRSLGRLSTSSDYGLSRCVHSTRTRQTPNLHTLIAERLKQYVDPNSPKPTRTYADRLGTFNLSPSKHGNERKSASHNEDTVRRRLSGDRRSAHHREITLRERLSADRRFDSMADEHLYPVEPRPKRHEARSWSDNATSSRNSNDAGSSSFDTVLKPTTRATPAYTGSNRFASAAKSTTSTSSSQATEKGRHKKNKTKKNGISMPFDRVPDAFELNFDTARRDDSTMKSPTVEMKHPQTASLAINNGRQSSPLERNTKAPELVNDIYTTTTVTPADSLAMKSPTGEPDILKGPTIASEAMPHQKASAQDRKAYRELESWATDPSLPKWGRVRTLRSMSRMIDRLCETRLDRITLYCHIPTESHPHAMLIYSSEDQLVYQIDLAELGHHGAFEHVGKEQKQMNLARLLQESTGSLFFHGLRKAASVICGLYNIDLHGVYDLQIMQSMAHPAHEEKSLEEGVMVYLSETGQSLEKYQRLLKERETAFQEHAERNIMSKLRLPATRNVLLYQFSLMPQMTDHYLAKLGDSVGKCLEESARRVEEAKLELEETAKHMHGREDV